MSEREILFHWLVQYTKRLRLNWLLRELGWLGSSLFGLAVLYQTLKAAIDSPVVIASLVPLFILSCVGVVIAFAVRLRSRPTLAQAAGDADSRARLQDQLQSAYWFLSRSGPTPAVELLLRRASQTALRLAPRELFPVAIPFSLIVAVVLASIAGGLAWFSPHLAYSTTEASADGQNVIAARNVRTSPAQLQSKRDRSLRVGEGGKTAPESRLQSDAMAWARAEELMRGIEHAPDMAAIRSAVADRDAKRVAHLLEAMQQKQAAAGASAQPEGEQMSTEIAQSILTRLQDLLSADGQSSDAASQAGADLGKQPAARVTQGPAPDSMDEQWSNNPGRHSEGETALNSLLRSISRSSIGDRQAVRAEGDSWQEGGRSNATGGAMGRRVGVSQAGAGDNEAPTGNPNGDVASDAVLGKRTQRLEAQMQRVRLERGDNQNDAGTTETSYAATQGQAATLGYQSVAARQQVSDEVRMSEGQTPPAYRSAVKSYFLTEHRKEQ